MEQHDSRKYEKPEKCMYPLEKNQKNLEINNKRPKTELDVIEM